MSKEPCALRVENAIAAASAASFRLLRPVPLEQDEIAKAIVWRPDIDRFDEIIGTRFPGVESLRRILPGGDPRALWRYRFFEIAANPAETNCERVLEALSTAISVRGVGSVAWGPTSGADSMPSLGVGPFLMGPLGIVELPRTAWTGALECVHPSYLDWEFATLPSEWADRDSICVGRAEDLSLDEWSDCWRDSLQAEVSSHGGEAYLMQWERGAWSPDSHANDMLGACTDSLYSHLVALSSPRDTLSRLLEVCFERCRAEFFDRVRYDFAPTAQKACHDRVRRDLLSLAELWQLLHICKIESVVALSRELGVIRGQMASGCYAENLAHALLTASERVGDDSALQQFFGHAQGAKIDQVLHLILRQSRPDDLLSRLLIDGRLSRALAELTAAPLGFQNPKHDAWDPTDPNQQSLLVRSIAEALGEQRVPTINSDALPLASIAGQVDRRDKGELRAGISAGRVRCEWILKTAVQYLYSLLTPNPFNSKAGAFDGSSVREMLVLGSDPGIVNWAGRQSPPIDLCRMTVGGWISLHAHLRQSVSAHVPKHVHEVLRGQVELLRLFSADRVAESGNLGPHLNSASMEDLLSGLGRLAAFDRAAREIPDALPGFVRFVKEVREPNKPSLVTVEPISEVGVPVPKGKRVHYISRDPILQALRGDRVYSFTDVTRNEISVNPIVIDWTDWLREV